MSQIELGNNFVSAETLEKLCSALEIQPKILFDFETTNDEKKNMKSEIISKLNKNKSLIPTIYKIIIALDE